VSRFFAGRLTDSLGAKPVAIAGFLIVGLATVPFAFVTATTNQWALMAVLVVRGFGLGAVLVPLMTVAYIGLDRAEVPHASIITRIVQQVGGSFGVALLAIILENALSSVGRGATLADGFDLAFWWAVGFTALGVIVAFALPGRKRVVIVPQAVDAA
jgi:MFS family permease